MTKKPDNRGGGGGNNMANIQPKVDGDALYEYAVMKAFGLCSQEKNNEEAMLFFTRAAKLGHPISVLGLHVPSTHVLPLCRCKYISNHKEFQNIYTSLYQYFLL